MKKFIIGGLFLSSVLASSYAAAWTVYKTYPLGSGINYQIQCSDGSFADVLKGGDTVYTATGRNSGTIKTFWGLSEAAAYACGE